jgi:glutamyl-tRNA synthetase
MRTRFAPSPTGFLHLGGARTALFSWLYARKHQGEFILRIEDTDVERSSQEAVDAIIDGMNWLGLDYDEGPVFQMQRMARYQEVIQQLLSEAKIYKCYCSKERLEKLREMQMANKEKPRYDGRCRNLVEEAEGEPFVLRFKTPLQGSVIFDDLVKGPIEVNNAELDDLIIQRTDGTPTYNFTVVVDDLDMNITTVIRGDDHINNTPRQINILLALGVIPPQYAHVPMILGQDGKRLSKRHGAMSVTQYREDGYLPEAMLNYLVRLGWSHGDQEIFSKEEMISLFDLQDVNRAPAAFNTEKLQWLNQHYLKTESPDYIAGLLAKHLQMIKVDIANGPELILVVNALRERSKTLVEMAEKAACFYQDKVVYDVKAADKFLNEDILPVFEFLHVQLQNIIDWNEDSIGAVFKLSLETFNLKMPKLAQPLRVALVGSTQSPGISTTLHLLGKDKALHNISQALDYLKVL